MDYREIVAVTGIGGLFHLMATKSDGAIVRNLADKSTKFIPARLHNVTPLESIEVYTISDNVRLHVVFQKMKENEHVAMPDAKKASNNDIKSYFKGIFPEFDEERVYVSDMKKMLKWFDILKANDLLNFDYLKDEAIEEVAETEEVVEEKPKKKAKSTKEADAAEEVAEKPKKSAAKKKKEESTEESTEEKPKKTAKKKKEE